MDLVNLKNILRDQPKFRYKQVEKAIYQELISDWSEATSLPLALREKLSEECSLEIKADLTESQGTKKALIGLHDGLSIETVLMTHKDGRHTVCVSSQVGCPMGCLFCATGKLGFKRNLEQDEIVEQVLYFARMLKKTDEKITNIVYMGMGEPFLNYENVIGSIRFLNSPETLNLGARRFSISTAGVTHGIRKLANENLEVNLAFSLHAPNESLRTEIMPINKKYSLLKVLKTIDEYIEITHRRVMFEYVMIKDLNDTTVHAKQLAKLIRGRLGFVNLIAYNKTSMFEPSTSETIKKFREILEKEKISVVQRHAFGQGIDAACGQLSGKKKIR